MDNRLGTTKQAAINKKGFVIGGFVIVVVIVVFFMLLKLSVPSVQAREETTEEIDFSAGEMWLHGLQQKVKEPQKTIIADTSPAEIKAQINPHENEVFKQGSESEISVYRGEMREAVKENAEVKTINEQPKPQNETRLFNYEQQLSDYEIKAGSIIPAILQTEIHSDLPGMIIAKVRQSVFDTKNGHYLLIPQGTTILGQYDSSISYGQERILIYWERLIFPNGDSFDLQAQPGIDGLGRSGLKDKVNNHFFKIFGSSALFSILSAGSSLSGGTSDEGSTQAVIGQAVGQQMASTGMTLLNKNLNIAPTLTIRAGTRFNVLLRQDLVFPTEYHE